MFNLGFGEILLVALIALIFLGPEQLPEVAKMLARLVNEWKRATSDLTGTISSSIKDDLKERISESRAEKEPPPASADEHKDNHES